MAHFSGPLFPSLRFMLRIEPVGRFARKNTGFLAARPFSARFRLGGYPRGWPGGLFPRPVSQRFGSPLFARCRGARDRRNSFRRSRLSRQALLPGRRAALLGRQAFRGLHLFESWRKRTARALRAFLRAKRWADLGDPGRLGV